MAGGVAIQAAVSRPDVANHISIGWSGSQAPFPTVIQWASFARRTGHDGPEGTYAVNRLKPGSIRIRPLVVPPVTCQRVGQSLENDARHGPHRNGTAIGI